MKNHLLLCLLPVSLLIACQSNNDQAAILQTKDVKRIVLVGGSLISSMENFGFFEHAVTSHYHPHPVSFRNIGWAADDVYGVARSQFGSAQNTRSWRPPSAEEGFGSKVLLEHIKAAAPKTLIIGYGSETAFAKNEEDFALFTSGYERLLDFAEEQGIKLVLLSPPKHELAFSTQAANDNENTWLAKASTFIKEQAVSRNHLSIDLFQELITDPTQQLYTENGIQLNQEGYQKMNEILLKNLGIERAEHFTISIDKKAAIVQSENCKISDWVETVRGVSFNLTPHKTLSNGQLHSKEPVAIYVNGQLVANSQDTVSTVSLLAEVGQQDRLMATIKEKNRLHRYRLRPLNEAYIYLFRRHEMGHLAYEMDDLDRLVEEKEREISRMFSTQNYDVEIELIQAWQSPKNYPEDEVPAYIPEPNIEEEIAAFNIADGFEISLFAADPMIANPINVNWDTKGRAWVATSSTYPHIVPGREPNDKIIILEDTDKDGVADKHTVFAENLLVPHSVMPVPGGAYVVATTELLFFADTDGDDVADERRVVYDGFGNADVHHMIHGLRWAPWGDLHFTQSIYINSFIETPFGKRILNGSGIWSFRPETERLEVFSRGLINPWGEAFDQWGQAFATDGAGSSGINYVFPESAHATAVGTPEVLNGLNSNTPKNTAAEIIYSRHFPAEWQGTVITNDFRANRTVRYKISPEQSGYSSEEVQTVLRSDHRSYRPVDAKIGPDGALYIVDWYNPIIDHGEVDFHHPIRDRSHGRIWKLTRKGKPLIPVVNMNTGDPVNLLQHLKSPEQFTRLQANRAFVEQKGDPKAVIQWIKGLNKGAANYAQHRLEGLWLLAALNHYDEDVLMASLSSRTALERAAAVRQLAHWKKQAAHPAVLERLINDRHPQVRLEAIHAVREMGGLAAVELAIKVLDHPMDANLEFALNFTLRTLQEAWLPAMVKQEKLFNGQVDKQLYALVTSEDSRVIPPIMKLLDTPSIDSTVAAKGWQLMAKIGDANAREKVFQKAVATQDPILIAALINAPAAYDAVPDNLTLLEPLLAHDSLQVRIAGLRLVGRWKATQFEAQVLEMLQTASLQSEKLAAARALVAIDKLSEIEDIAQSATDPGIRTAASAVWIEEDPGAASSNAITLLATLDKPELAEVLFSTFRRIEEGPEILRKALDGKTLPEEIAMVGVTMTQTSGLNLFELEDALRKAGSIQPIGMEMSAEEKEALIQAAIQSDNPYRGRQIYRKNELLCATCHRMNGVGGLAGPDLTTVGSFMTPNSILESILNPNSDIKQGYETVILTKKNGEVISGLLHRKTNNATLIRLVNGKIIEVPAAEIEGLDVSPASLMPPGLTRNLHKDELKDLLAFLIHLGAEE